MCGCGRSRTRRRTTSEASRSAGAPTTTSAGRSNEATLTSSRPDRVWATTSSPRASRTAAMPARTRASSSATAAYSGAGPPGSRVTGASRGRDLRRLPTGGREVCNRPRKAVSSFIPSANQDQGRHSPKSGCDIRNKPGTNTDSGGKRVKSAQKADIDIERANYEDALVRQHLPLVQYVVSEVAHRVPSHVSRSDLVS